jgi:hypothetical protein
MMIPRAVSLSGVVTTKVSIKTLLQVFFKEGIILLVGFNRKNSTRFKHHFTGLVRGHIEGDLKGDMFTESKAPTNPAAFDK